MILKEYSTVKTRNSHVSVFFSPTRNIVLYKRNGEKWNAVRFSFEFNINRYNLTLSEAKDFLAHFIVVSEPRNNYDDFNELSAKSLIETKAGKFFPITIDEYTQGDNYYRATVNGVSHFLRQTLMKKWIYLTNTQPKVNRMTYLSDMRFMENIPACYSFIIAQLPDDVIECLSDYFRDVNENIESFFSQVGDS